MCAGRFRCGRPVFPAAQFAEAGVLAIARLLPQVAAQPSPAEVGPEVVAKPPIKKRLGGLNTCRSASSSRLFGESRRARRAVSLSPATWNLMRPIG